MMLPRLSHTWSFLSGVVLLIAAAASRADVPTLTVYT